MEEKGLGIRVKGNEESATVSIMIHLATPPQAISMCMSFLFHALKMRLTEKILLEHVAELKKIFPKEVQQLAVIEAILKNSCIENKVMSPIQWRHDGGNFFTIDVAMKQTETQIGKEREPKSIGLYPHP